MPKENRFNQFRSVVQAKLKGGSIPVIQLVQSNPEFAASLSKLVTPDIKPVHDERGERTIQTADRARFFSIAEYIANKTNDAEIAMQLFPEMELAAQILISSIISPKDMTTTEVNYVVPEGLKVAPVSSKLLTIISDYFEQTYKIKPLLPKILNNILFGSGSYPIAIIPENTVDSLINGKRTVNTESLKDHVNNDGLFHPIGILGLPNKDSNKNFSLEDFSAESYMPSKLTNIDQDKIQRIHWFNKTSNSSITLEHIFITDNYDALKFQQLIKRKRAETFDALLNRNNVYHAKAFESLKQSVKLSDQELTSLFYKNRNTSWKNVVKVKTDGENSRSTIGEPLIMKLPSESVIPVYTPGNPEDHVGYFILLDMEGNPITRNTAETDFSNLRSKFNQNQDLASRMLQEVNSAFHGSCHGRSFDDISRIYSDVIEADLLAKLRNGLVGPGVTIAKNTDLYQIMLARILKKQNTQLLYVPTELMTYFALDYDDVGIGKSLNDGQRIINSLRAMLLFSNVQASIKNSIARKKVNIKLTDTDPDPQKTIEIAQSEILRIAAANFPVGMMNPNDLTDWLQKAGYEWGFEGHPGLPDTSVEINEVNSNYVKPDSDLEDSLRKRAIMHTGLSPETVDNGFNSEFATTVVANNILLSKRVLQIQEKFVPQLTDLCRKVAMNDGNVVKYVKKVIEENYSALTETENVDELISEYKDQKDLLVHLLAMEFLSNFELKLAQPDTVSLKNLIEAFDAEAEAVDKAIEYYISTNVLPAAFSGEQANQRVDEIKQIVKAHHMRQYMANNHILPELANYFKFDKNGKPVNDIFSIEKEYQQGIIASIVKLMQRTVPIAQAADRDIEKITDGENLGPSQATDTSELSNDGEEDENTNSDKSKEIPEDLPDLGSIDM